MTRLSRIATCQCGETIMLMTSVTQERHRRRRRTQWHLDEGSSVPLESINNGLSLLITNNWLRETTGRHITRNLIFCQVSGIIIIIMEIAPPLYIETLSRLDTWCSIVHQKIFFSNNWNYIFSYHHIMLQAIDKINVGIGNIRPWYCCCCCCNTINSYC